MNKTTLINQWALICGNTSVDQSTNSLSVLNTFEEMIIHPSNKTSKIPEAGVSIAVPHEFVSLWRREGDSKDALSIKFALRLLDPKENIIFENKVNEMKFEKGKANLRLIVKSNGLKITHPGRYQYQIEILDPAFKQDRLTTADFAVKIDNK